MIEQMKTIFSLSYACLCRQTGLSYATLMRWNWRYGANRGTHFIWSVAWGASRW